MDNQTENDMYIVGVLLLIGVVLLFVIPPLGLLAIGVIYWICRIGNKIKNGD